MDARQTCRLFVTGTDTGIGKTRATLALMEACKARGMTAAGMKPVASGCEKMESVLTNRDALEIQACSTTRLSYNAVNPYAFAPPIAPHIAATRAGTRIDPAVIEQAYATLAAQHDCVVVEGVGGWRVPLSADFSTVDLVRLLRLPVVLVVGLRLGCINHALLSHECMQNDGIQIAGWLANRLDPEYGEVEETLRLLEEKFPAPLLGVLPYQVQPVAEDLAASINIAQVCR